MILYMSPMDLLRGHTPLFSIYVPHPFVFNTWVFEHMIFGQKGDFLFLWGYNFD
jgi:hypothetical protein